ncbi:hypothetical protein TNCV_3185391 [Trichonephila clavipes]|nr:hypothetical protein TNCV_3185391 [Trichonephila clavipes]
MSYEVQLAFTSLYQPVAVGEESLPDSKLVLTENEGSVSGFRLTLYKWSDDSHLCDEQQHFTLLGSTSHNVQDTFFQAWAAYSSSSINIMSGDVERTCFTKLTKNRILKMTRSVRKLRVIYS